MENSDTSQLGLIYENAILIKGPIGDLMGDISGYEDSGDDYDCTEHDSDEVHMALSELKKLAEYSSKLYDKIENEKGLEGWVASKITKAADYISSVYHWLNYDLEKDDCGCEDDYYEDEEELY